MKRLLEILARKKEIRSALDSATPEQLEAYEAELEELEKEERSLQKRQAIIQRLSDNPTLGNEVTPPGAGAENEDADERTAMLNSMEYRRAFMNFTMRKTPIPTELRADATTMTTDVGAAIPTVLVEKIIEKMEKIGTIYNMVTRSNIAAGVSIPISNIKPVATWVDEGKGSEKQKLTLDNITFNHYKLRCALSKTLESGVLTISAFETMFVRCVADAMVKALELSIIAGTGVKQPKGIITHATAVDQSLDLDISYDSLLEAEAALPEEYEANAVWVMTKKTFMKFMGIKDENGQPIARVNAGLSARPERYLNGRPVITISSGLPSYSASLDTGDVYAFIFNLEDYILNMAYDITVKTYEDNETDDTVTKAIALADGKIGDINSLVLLKK